MKLLRLFAAELIGTYFLVFFGTGAMMVNEIYGGVISHLGVALAFGVGVMSMIFVFGDVSGAHMNPAVSLSFFAMKRISWQKTSGYIIFQLFGAVLASLSLSILFPQAISFGETVPQGTWEQSFLMEFILSFFLMLVIIFVATGSKEKGIMAALAIGFAVFVCALVGGPISVASMNPARSFGPAVFSGDWTHFWLYIIAPVFAMLFAVGIWSLLKLEVDE